MSTAFDLTASLSLPELEMDSGDPANGPGPWTLWSPPQQTRCGGSEACDPPAPTVLAPTGPRECAGTGASEIGDSAGPVMPSGEPYPGDLLTDILEYRRIRARVLGGGVLPKSMVRRYEVLQDLVGAVAGRDKGRGRAFHRFDLRVGGSLRMAEGAAVKVIDVGVDNLSAGGVKLAGAGVRAAGERVELLMDAGDGRTVVLPARVAWTRGPAVGLMFAGAARWR